MPVQVGYSISSVQQVCFTLLQRRVGGSIIVTDEDRIPDKMEHWLDSI